MKVSFNTRSKFFQLTILGCLMFMTGALWANAELGTVAFNNFTKLYQSLARNKAEFDVCKIDSKELMATVDAHVKAAGGEAKEMASLKKTFEQQLVIEQRQAAANFRCPPDVKKEKLEFQKDFLAQQKRFIQTYAQYNEAH